MNIFCTKCGASNQPSAAFCENCGVPLRAVTANLSATDVALKMSDSTKNARLVKSAGSTSRKKIIYGSSGLAIALLVSGGIAFYVTRPPIPTAAVLLAATKAAYGKEANNRTRQVQLCLTNIDYSKNPINVAEADVPNQMWMNTLVAAGLYKPAVIINASGTYTSTLLQYTATDQLAQYREGARLCTAKTVEVVGVINIETPVSQEIGSAGGQAKILEVKAQLVLKALDMAPWMQKPEVREKVLAKVSGWTYNDQSLQKQINQYYGLVGGKCTAGNVYKDAIREQMTSAQRSNELKSEIIDHAKNAAGITEMISGITSSLFSGFGGKSNPLFGRWRSADGSEIEFSASSCVSSSAGSSARCSYNIDGKTITFKSNFHSSDFPEGHGIAVMQNQNLMTLENGRKRATFRRIP